MANATIPCAERPAFDPVRTVWQVAAVSVGWCAVILTAGHTRTGAGGHRVALAIHLLSLATGFGAVLAVDGYALAVLLGRRTIVHLLAFSAVADRYIWLGFTALGLSGVYLNADIGGFWTGLNMAAFLVVGLNGVYARTIRERLPTLPPGAGARALPRPWLLRALLAGLLSQAAWWTSILIGSLAS